MRRLFILIFFVVPAICSANTLPLLPSQSEQPNHKFFISTQNGSSDSFDIWKVDSGYSYSVFKNIDLYVGARINSTSLKHENGFLSGVTYQLSDKVSFNSTLHTYTDNSNDNQSAMAAELSSRVQLTDNLDLHATLDYEEWQQGVKVGLGFRF